MGRFLALLFIAVMAGAGAHGYTASVGSVPKASALDSYIRDERALVILGKALYWDMQLSSDSRVACVSCHFHAGADHRLYNRLSSSKGRSEALESNGFSVRS
jgi:cytochrome c peroxidase